MDRYVSQFLFFRDINRKIFSSTVTIIGIGGLGSYLSEILARMGVKKIILVDFDKVEEKNLNRQNFILEDIGKYKVDAIEKRLKSIRNDIEIEKYLEINEKVLESDMLFDCTDNINSKYLINEFSVYLGKPYIFGSVVMDRGFVGLINPNEFCLYDIYLGKEDLISCETAGVDPSSILFASSIMAKLFIKYLEGDRNSVVYHFNTNKKFYIEEIKVVRRECPICVKKDYKFIWKYMK